MATMRAKFMVNDVLVHKNSDDSTSAETLKMNAVTDKPFDEKGTSEDSDFSRWSPSGWFEIYVANPNLFGKFVKGKKFYLDFTEATE